MKEHSLEHFKRWLEEHPNPHYPDSYDARMVEAEDGTKLFIEIKARAESGRRDMFNVVVWHKTYKDNHEATYDVYMSTSNTYVGEHASEKAERYADQLEAEIESNSEQAFLWNYRQ